jgi:hypothetical protein
VRLPVAPVHSENMRVPSIFRSTCMNPASRSSSKAVAAFQDEQWLPGLVSPATIRALHRLQAARPA